MSSDLRRWALDTAERAGKTFVQAYLAVWVVAGADFDHLFTRDNAEGGVVGLALAVAAAVGAKQIGANDSASLLPADVDPPQDDLARRLLPYDSEPSTRDRGAVDLGTVSTICLVIIAVVSVLFAFGELPL